MLSRDSDYFLELQTQTGWGRTLYGFATWCNPKSGWRTLDVGCGPGLLPAIFSRLGCQAVGIDLDASMFHPTALYPIVAVANIRGLPFKLHTFELITASNLLFLLPDPVNALRSIKPFLAPGGRVAMLNPSESLNEQAAEQFAVDKGFQGLARETLIHWARRAEQNYHWMEDETRHLYRVAGMKCMGCAQKIGPGFGWFSWGVVEDSR